MNKFIVKPNKSVKEIIDEFPAPLAPHKAEEIELRDLREICSRMDEGEINYSPVVFTPNFIAEKSETYRKWDVARKNSQ